MTVRSTAHRDALTALERVLGAPPPSSLAALDAGELNRLREVVEEAKARHSEALSVALDAALLQVPMLLRGAVTRIVVR
jgi:hypothetical protein